jgi:hypothetical protein
MRGLPRIKALQKVDIAHTLSKVLRDNAIEVEPDEATIGDDGLNLCFRYGWLHADKVSNDEGKKTAYVFSSPLHRWYVEWKLYDTTPRIPFETTSILRFVRDVIVKFSPYKLSTEQRIGPGCIQRPPEAQYQDEFYRSCHAYSNGSLQTFPEFSTAKGRVDFYIPSKEWGVELLRDGDRLEEHSGRFSESGAYGTTLKLSDYIILDCRKTWPMRPHPGMCIICPIHFSCQADLGHRNSEIVPRCI